jgi:hypothetical protein
VWEQTKEGTLRNHFTLIGYLFLGLPEHRWASTIRACQTGLVAIAFGGCLQMLLRHVADWSLEFNRCTAAVLIAVLLAVMHMRLIKARPDHFASALFGVGCALMFYGGKLGNMEVPDEYGFAVQWMKPFLLGWFLVFRIYTDGNTGLTTAESIRLP